MRRSTALLLALILLLPASLAGADQRAYYEIFPASFYDANGDGHGDLAGIEAKLDYLVNLGVGGVWLMPVHPSPSYHKYDATDYYAVDPAYGTLEDFASLAAGLHARDMTLLLDLVINHTSSQHPWFLSATQSLAVEPCGQATCSLDPLCRDHNPYVLYYHFAQENTPGWHTVPNAEGWYYMGHFTYEMPDLNLANAEALAEVQAICAFWLDMGVDGFRLDAVPHYFEENVTENNAFVAWLMDTLRGLKPDVYVVGEVWKDAGSIARYYESGISAIFNYPFSGAEGAIVSAIRGKKGASFAQKAADWQHTLSAFPGAVDAPFLSNHDNARIAGTLMRNPDTLKLAASLYLTLPGTPFLYYGEEIGMTGSGRDENKRLPMVWGSAETPGVCQPPPNADQTADSLGSVAAQLTDDDSLLSHYQYLLSLRKTHTALQNGSIVPIDSGNAALCAYTLANDAETLLVVHNLGKAAATLVYLGHTYTVPSLGSVVEPVSPP